MQSSPLQGPLPHLRQDLALHVAPPAIDGSPCWHLHDPAANHFYQIGWVAFEILSRWSLETPEAIVSAVNAETTLEIDTDTIKSVADFLERHHLLAGNDAKNSARLIAARAARRHHWAKWLLHNYLFFRVPLLRPDAWLDHWVHLIRPLLDRRFWLVIAALAGTALILVARQWEQFLHGFTAYSGWENALAFALALSIAKMAHELGHGFVAKYHGCKVPTMGVAFLVMWPVLYTDTNEAWKLPSNRARFQIALAGMAAESLVAVLATWAWLLLPDGPLRAAALFIATTSWVMTLALNASPFLRFDGYFLLIDTVGLPNLHARAFALGRWWMRERLFDLNEPPPEHFSLRQQRFLVAFAFATWLYRFLIFLSIAMLVYYTFFKALGILLMLVEVGWFIIRPLMQEIEAWWQRRHGMAWNRATRRTVTVVALFFAWLLLPWQGEIRVPGLLTPAQEQNFYAPMAGRVAENAITLQKSVQAGEVLLKLQSPDLEHRLELARIKAKTWSNQLEQQAFNEQLSGQGDVLKHHWEEAGAQLTGLTEEQARLTLRAAFDGEIVFRADDLVLGAWVAGRERLLSVVNRSNSIVDAFVGDSDLDRLHIGAAARFIPDAPEFGRRNCRIGDIERVNLAVIDDPGLASTHGGPLPSRQDRHGAALPASPLYRIRLEQCDPSSAPALRLRGVVHLDADGRSLLAGAFTKLLAVLIRESGF